MVNSAAMRLTANQARTILDTSQSLLGNEVEVMLFGSRADDEAKGGDIDLLIETRNPVGVWRQAQLLAELEKRLGLPVDVVLHASDEPEKPIHRIARLSGVKLS